MTMLPPILSPQSSTGHHKAPVAQPLGGLDSCRALTSISETDLLLLPSSQQVHGQTRPGNIKANNVQVYC